MSTKKDFPSVYESFPSKLTIGNGIELETNKRRHTGQNNLNDIIWYEYKIVNYKEKNLEYDNICISFCKVTELERQNASKHVFETKVSLPETIRPHIDANSGNIHPSKEFIKKHTSRQISQLVLCNGLGPSVKLSKSLDLSNNNDFYIYTKKKAVQKACYFPLIDEHDSNLVNNWRYKLLEELWEILKDLEI